MIHFYSSYASKNPDVQRCHDLARESWLRLDWSDVPVLDAQLPRTFLGDGKPMPYLKDVWDKGIAGVSDDEICVFTNTDIQVRSDAVVEIAYALQFTDAAYCFRRDFPPKLNGLIPDADYVKGHPYSGSDLYAFRAGWWRQHRGDMPDMLIGYEGADPVLRRLIEETNTYGVITGVKQCQMSDLIAHEKNGDSWWELPQNRYRLKGQIYNLKLAVAWMARRGIPARVHGIPHDFLTRHKLCHGWKRR